NATVASLGAVVLGAMPSLSTAEERPHSISPGRSERRKKSFPNVPLVTHEGDTVQFYDDLIKDKTVLINFMYARCADICPGMTANLKLVQKEFGERMGRDIFMYSITLEPEHDTQAVLKAYTELFRVKPGWKFLTGRKNDIELLRRQLGFTFSDPVLDQDRTQHIGVVKYGIEPLERWGTCPALGNPKYIAEYIYWMEPGGQRPNQSEMMG
ncbi:MAG: SCO family protein, partial [Methylobacter sp.]